ncbi:MAG: NAD(P)-dependent oxidoreductase, partial [Mariprofundaceae bacterium]|nr:NAD(P)-dependent oxidoreductase [Mariprofundaceae bacterium]
LFVEDLLEAMLLAGLVEAAVGEIINIGSGESVCIADVAALAGALTGSRGLIRYGSVPYRPGETMSYAMCIDKARRVLGWNPSCSLEEGLLRTVRFYSNGPDDEA